MPGARGETESLWFSTRSALFEPGDDAWNEVALYHEPLSRLIARRWPWVSAADRDDLVQDMLLEIKGSLAPRHDPARGKFRALLQTVLARRLADLRRGRREAPLGEDVPAPDATVVAALDLEALLLDAVTACRDRFTQGKTKDQAVVYALADRIVNGLSNAEIARRDRVSVDRVARLLEKGRDAIFERLLGRELALAADDPRLAHAVTTFKESLRRPGASESLLAGMGDARVRAGLADFLERLRASLPELASDGSARGAELRRGLALIFEGPA